MAYEEYLRKYPGGKYIEVAKSRLENLDRGSQNGHATDSKELKAWKKAKNKNTKLSYQHFINSYPRSDYVKSAEIKIDKIEVDLWEVAETRNNLESYTGFLSEFPAGKFKEKAIVKIKEFDAEFNVSEFLEESMLNNILGRLLEYIPDTMYLGVPADALIKITIDTTEEREKYEEEKIREFLNDSSKNIESIIIAGIGKEMRAKLIDASPEDDKNFDIIPLIENSIRIIDFQNGKSSLWAWRVTPRKIGNHRISLTLERVIKDDKGTDHEIFNKEIKVVVKEAPLSQYLVWILIPVFVIVLALIYIIFKRRKKSSKFISQINNYKELIELISLNKTEQALKSIKEQNISPEYSNQIVMLLSRLESNSDKSRKGISDHTTLAIERNKINSDLLDIINEIKNIHNK